MVRLRKNRWYSGENQQQIQRRAATHSVGTRRLISLVFLLALVLVLMQRVSDPKVVRQAFQAVGAPLDREIVAESHPSPQQFALDSDSELQVSDAVQNFTSSQPSDGRKADQSTEHGTATNKYQPPDDGRWKSTCDDLVPRILKSAEPSSIQLLSRYSFSDSDSSKDNLQSAELTAEIARLSQAAQSLIDDFGSQLISEDSTSGNAVWLALLKRFASEWEALLKSVERKNSGVPEAVSPDYGPSLELRDALEGFLDEKLIKGLRDAAPWQQSESLAFWRLLQRSCSFDRTKDLNQADMTLRLIDSQRSNVSSGSSPSNDLDSNNHSTSGSPPLVTTHQLQANFTELRGSWIRYRGTVRRVEHVVRSSPLFRMDGYWVMWLQGSDEASQPVGVYTGLEMAGAFSKAVSARQYPEIELTGLVGKRLAYSSPAGLQVSPTIFAGSMIQFAQDNASHHQGAATRDRSGTNAQIIYTLLVAALISLIVVIPIWGNFQRKSRATAKTISRRQRQSGRLPICFLPIWLSVVLGTQQLSIAHPQAPPWADLDNKPREIESIAEQLLTDAFDEDYWRDAGLLQEEPSESATDGMLKLLHVLDKIGWERLWSMGRDISVGKEHHLRPTQLAGWARQLQSLELNEHQREWFSVKPRQAIYQLNLADAQATLVRPNIFCLNVPTFWLNCKDLWQPASIRGFTLERTSDGLSNIEEHSRVLCMLAEAPSWMAAKPNRNAFLNARPRLPDHWQELAEAGWDLHWIELLRDSNEKSLSETEREPFLKLIQLADAGTLVCNSAKRKPMEVLGDSKKHHCCCVDWKVRLVKGSRVERAGPQDGLPQVYYQLDGFVKMPGQRVEYVPANGTERAVFEGEFPVTIVLAGESEFIPTESRQSGEHSWQIGRHAQLKGRFYRMWSYHSERLESSSAKGRQLAPLIVAENLLPARPDPIPASPVGWFGVAMGVGVVLIMAGIMTLVFKDRFRSPS